MIAPMRLQACDARAITRSMGQVRKVVDSNCLRSPRLAAYLRRSSENVAVLTEFVILEAHKESPLVTVPASFEILSRFPGQVAVLRTSQNLLGFRGRSSGLQKRLIDRRASANFQNFCRTVRSATAGDVASQSEILRTSNIASRHISSLVDAASSVIATFQDHARRFTQAELRIIRLREPYPDETQLKLIDIMFESATDIARATNAVPAGINPAEIVNLPVFRYSLAMAVLLTRWIAAGRQESASPAKIANDVIDANIVAYATYFDGILSGDKKLLSLHAETRYVLREIGAQVPG